MLMVIMVVVVVVMSADTAQTNSYVMLLLHILYSNYEGRHCVGGPERLPGFTWYVSCRSL